MQLILTKDVGIQKYAKLEIWGRAQREAARRRKSDWGDS